jgi:hypothetical protein
MNAAVAAFASLSALMYAGATFLTLMKRWAPQAGSGMLSAAAVAAFVLDRFVPQNDAAAAIASLVTIAALVRIARRSSPAYAGIMSAVPLCVMLLALDRPFFPAQTQAQFQTAMIALLCAAAPLCVISLLLGKLTSRKRSFR